MTAVAVVNISLVRKDLKGGHIDIYISIYMYVYVCICVYIYICG